MIIDIKGIKQTFEQARQKQQKEYEQYQMAGSNVPIELQKIRVKKGLKIPFLGEDLTQITTTKKEIQKGPFLYLAPNKNIHVKSILPLK